MATETDYVTLISSDDYSFVVQRSAACLSPAIKRMLDPSSEFASFHLLSFQFTHHSPPLSVPLNQKSRGKCHLFSNKFIQDGFLEAKTNTCRFDNIKYVLPQ